MRNPNTATNEVIDYNSASAKSTPLDLNPKQSDNRLTVKKSKG